MVISESNKTKNQKNQKNKVNNVEIISELVGKKIYYSIRYSIDGDIYVGYSSYNIDIVLNYIKEYFEIIPA